jgi:signal transduction histidine kinase
MNPCRVLLLEDDPLDAELILAHLADGGVVCAASRVDTRDGFRAALAGPLDLILADYSLPTFDGAEALQLARRERPEVPFLFVSGAMGEEKAVEALRAGATDYVLKHRLERLAPCVRRALREAEDRAERQRLQDALAERARQLADADRRKNEFLAMLAHELRNPLAPILNAAQLMRLRGLGDPALAWARDVVERQAQHLTRLVDDLVDVARLTRGRVELRRQEVTLAEIVSRAVETARPLVQSRGHSLEVRLPASSLMLSADPDRLAQALGNLLNNAARYTEPGGRIEVWAEEAGPEEVAVHVRDSGVGLGPDLLPRVFDLFAQSERSLARSEGGLGVGLTLTRGLVELHGGRVSAHSNGPGTGSTFTVRLPTGPAVSVAPRPASADEPPPVAGRSRSVLVVDDNAEAADTLVLLLQLAGHRIRVAHGAAEALSVVTSFLPDVVLVALGLPGDDGYTLGRQLRQQPGLERALLVGLTGYAHADDDARAVAAGFTHQLAKPVDPDALEALLR